MSWTAPELDHLLEERLKIARDELMEDTRIASALDDGAGESHVFVAQLIEEKISAAAGVGLEAVEASLRVDATECLLENGHGVETVRGHLEQLAGPFRKPKPLRRSGFSEIAFSPLILASLAFAVWTALVLLIWAALRFHPGWLVPTVGAGIAPAYAVKRWREADLARLKREIADELPDKACRHYRQVMTEAVRDYEDEVNRLLEEKPAPAEQK